MKLYSVLFTVAILIFTTACNKPSNYDECILKYVKEDMNERAVNAVVSSCRNTFPENEEKENPNVSVRSLTSEELEKLTGRAGYEYGTYDGSIYNGNDEITVTEVEIAVRTTSEGEQVTRTYRDNDVYIKPKSTGSFSFSIISGDQDADYSWSITAAKGRNR